MNPNSPSEDDNNPLDARGYAAGDPEVVRAARPAEPSAADWDAVRRRIHARLSEAEKTSPRRPRRALWFAGAVVAALSAAAAVAWVAVTLTAPAPRPQPNAPEVVELKPQPPAEVAPAPHEPPPDPLADFAVLPIADSDEVVLHRVPGDGMLPVGRHPLSGELSLATAEDVELDDPNPAWPSVTPAPGFAPMIFAAKPR